MGLRIIDSGNRSFSGKRGGPYYVNGVLHDPFYLIDGIGQVEEEAVYRTTTLGNGVKEERVVNVLRGDYGYRDVTPEPLPEPATAGRR